MFLLSTSSLKGYWIHKIFILAKKANFEWIDLVVERNNFDTLNWEYLKTLVDVFELPIISITGPTKWMDKKKVDHLVSIAKTVWAQTITFSPPHTKPHLSQQFFELQKLKVPFFHNLVESFLLGIVFFDSVSHNVKC